MEELLVRLSPREELRFKDHFQAQEWSSTMHRSLTNSGRRTSHMYKEVLTELRHKNEALMWGQHKLVAHEEYRKISFERTGLGLGKSYEAESGVESSEK